jgi:hypothetical protein
MVSQEGRWEYTKNPLKIQAQAEGGIERLPEGEFLFVLLFSRERSTERRFKRI